MFILVYLEDVEEELAVVFAELPEEDEKLLVKVNLSYEYITILPYIVIYHNIKK